MGFKHVLQVIVTQANESDFNNLYESNYSDINSLHRYHACNM